MWLPWSTADGQLMCTPWEYAIEPCLTSGVGLLPWEWHHFSQRHLESTHGESGDSGQHALHAVHTEQHATSVTAQDGFNLTAHVVELEGKEAVAEAALFQHKPVVLLDNLVHVKLTDEQQHVFDKLQQECRVLNTTQILAKFDEVHWNFLEGRTVDVNIKIKAAVHLRSGKLHRRGQPLLVQQNEE